MAFRVVITESDQNPFVTCPSVGKRPAPKRICESEVCARAGRVDMPAGCRAADHPGLRACTAARTATATYSNSLAGTTSTPIPKCRPRQPSGHNHDQNADLPRVTRVADSRATSRNPASMQTSWRLTTFPSRRLCTCPGLCAADRSSPNVSRQRPRVLPDRSSAPGVRVVALHRARRRE
jgi:hypothetical protein